MNKFYGLVTLSVTEFVVTILVGLFVGQWVDRGVVRHQTSTWMLVGTGVGFVLGLVRLIRRLKGVMNE